MGFVLKMQMVVVDTFNRMSALPTLDVANF